LAIDAHYITAWQTPLLNMYRAITTANYSFPIDPSASAGLHNSYGLALRQKGDVDAAAVQFRLAMKARPGWQEPEDNLKKALVRSQSSH